MRIGSLLIIFLLFCTSCNDTKSSTADEDTIPDRCEIDESTDTANGDTPEGDTGSANDRDTPDVDVDVDVDGCTSIRELSFPFERPDGEIHFCRRCEKPTEKDPQCISTLWKESNEELCRKQPEYDCCGYPCVIEDLEPWGKDDIGDLHPENGYAMH